MTPHTRGEAPCPGRYVPYHPRSGSPPAEQTARERRVVLHIIQPGLAGLMDRVDRPEESAMTIMSIFRTFTDARTVAEQQAVAGGHRVQWMIWGHPPGSASAVCVVCGHTLRIERTRHGLFHLEGDALGACVRPQFAPLQVAGAGRKTA